MDLTQALLGVVAALLLWSLRVTYATRGEVKSVLQLLNGFGEQPGLIRDVVGMKREMQRFREHFLLGNADP